MKFVIAAQLSNTIRHLHGVTQTLVAAKKQTFYSSVLTCCLVESLEKIALQRFRGGGAALVRRSMGKATLSEYLNDIADNLYDSLC